MEKDLGDRTGDYNLFLGVSGNGDGRKLLIRYSPKPGNEEIVLENSLLSESDLDRSLRKYASWLALVQKGAPNIRPIMGREDIVPLTKGQISDFGKYYEHAKSDARSIR